MLLIHSHFRFAALLVTTASGLYACGSASPTSETASHDTFLTQTRVAQYREWAQVNPTPVIFHAVAAWSCVGGTLVNAPGPHLDKYITVYVNEVGKDAMLTQKTPLFPEGSVIVKEKMAAPNTPPELLTVMVKRGKGFNPTSGDWEYAVLNGKAAQVEEQGKIAKCQSCHQQQGSLDYTFRTAYLPASLEATLK